MSAAENGFGMNAFMPASVARDCEARSVLADMPTIAIGARADFAADTGNSASNWRYRRTISNPSITWKMRRLSSIHSVYAQ
jgi:hypothetical protein